MDRPHLDDEAMLGRLRRLAAEADPMPEEVLTAAVLALSTRDLDGQLAQLIGDSLETDAFEAVRAADAGGRLLTFAGGGVQVDLEVTASGPEVALIGQVSGAERAGCALERPGGATQPLELDELGRFLAAPVRRGPVRLRLRSTAGDPVLTAWVAV